MAAGEWDVHTFDAITQGPGWNFQGTVRHFPHEVKLDVARGLLVGIANRGGNGLVALVHKFIPGRVVQLFLDRSTNPATLQIVAGNQFDL